MRRTDHRAAHPWSAAHAHDTALFVALELSGSTWLIGSSTRGSDRISKHQVRAADTTIGNLWDCGTIPFKEIEAWRAPNGSTEKRKEIGGILVSAPPRTGKPSAWQRFARELTSMAYQRRAANHHFARCLMFQLL